MSNLPLSFIKVNKNVQNFILNKAKSKEKKGMILNEKDFFIYLIYPINSYGESAFCY